MLSIVGRGNAVSMDGLRLHEEFGPMDSVGKYTSLNLSSNGLTSLVIASNTVFQLVPFLNCIRVLHASHNRLSTLQGVDQFPSLEVLDVSHNALRVIDARSTAALRKLKNLRELDLSHNELQQANFSEDGSCDCGGALQRLNLSANRLANFPDLSAMRTLRDVNMANNRIHSISGLEGKVPHDVVGLSLRIDGNAIASWVDLLPLSALSHSLTAVSVGGNPFAASTPFSWRILLFGMLPGLRVVDGVAPTLEEQEVAENISHRLGDVSQSTANWQAIEGLLSKYCGSGSGSGSGSGMHEGDAYGFGGERTMLRESEDGSTNWTNSSGRGGNFVTYGQPNAPSSSSHYGGGGGGGSGGNGTQDLLQRYNELAASAGVWSSSSITTTANSLTSSAYPINTSNTPRNQQQHSQQQQQREEEEDGGEPYSTRRDTGGIPHATPNAMDEPRDMVLYAVQKKLKTITDVVRQLWQESMTRRTFAAITIQRYFRAHLTWSYMSPTVQWKLMNIRKHIREWKRTGLASTTQPGRSASAATPPPTRPTPRYADPSPSPAVVFPAAASTSSSSHYEGTTTAAAVKSLTVQMASMETLLRQLWNDTLPLKQHLARLESSAALKIQKHYRGYLARKQWRSLHSEYRAFLETLSPHVSILQRVSRGYIGRRMVGTVSRTSKKSTGIGSGELRELRAEVQDLRHLVRELQQQVEVMARRNRLDRYDDPERAMNELIARRRDAVENYGSRGGGLN